MKAAGGIDSYICDCSVYMYCSAVGQLEVLYGQAYESIY